ncbi:sigma factor-like helix-turn-helix DNA-binding protein [Nannocystis pusilla]|uniref:sigma factor-like helix-turn-helix DNA-binding protein n=1 Tax=Nannocystis pusilla TaxID=889268 RepID=UPI003B7798C8
MGRRGHRQHRAQRDSPPPRAAIVRLAGRSRRAGPHPDRLARGARAARADLRRALRLPADERIAFALRFIDEQPLGDVAAACDCSLATVKRRLSAAQARFRRLAERDPMLAEHLRELEVKR